VNGAAMTAFFVILGLAALYLVGHLLLLRDTKNLRIPKTTKRPDARDDDADDWPRR
jgi:hypothetical protein